MHAGIDSVGIYTNVSLVGADSLLLSYCVYLLLFAVSKKSL